MVAKEDGREVEVLLPLPERGGVLYVVNRDVYEDCRVTEFRMRGIDSVLSKLMNEQTSVWNVLTLPVLGGARLYLPVRHTSLNILRVLAHARFGLLEWYTIQWQQPRKLVHRSPAHPPPENGIRPSPEAAHHPPHRASSKQ